MATAAEIAAAQAAGYVTPTNSDMIRDGDDAITENAARSRADHESIRYHVLRRLLTAGKDLNEFLGADYMGWWTASTSTIAAQVLNAPTNRAGAAQSFALYVSAGITSQTAIIYTPGGPPTIKVRGRVSTAIPAVWSPWEELGGGGTSDASAALERATRSDHARLRVGGRVGTTGRPAVALRFDDAADAMDSTIMPRLRSRGLVAGWAATVRLLEDESAVAWSGVSSWARDGIELLGHSWTHQQATGTAAIRKEIIESADYIEGKVPEAAIDTWVMPGTGADAATYDQFGVGDVLANYYGHPAGRMIMQRYAVVDGAIPGAHRPLTGQPAVGLSHYTFEAATLADTLAQITAAMATGSGIVLMAHPSRFGTSGYMSLADLDALLDFLAAERDAERLLILTPRAMAYADRGSSTRLSLVPAVTTPSAWTTSSGWTAAGGVTSSSGTAALSHTVSISPTGYLKGGVFEVAVLVKASTAGSTVQLAVSGAAARTTTHTVGTAWMWVRMPFTLPRNAAWNATLTAAISRTAGGRIDLAAAVVRPT